MHAPRLGQRLSQVHQQAQGLAEWHQKDLAMGGVCAVGAPEAGEVLQSVDGGLAAACQEVQVLVVVGFQVLQIVLRYQGAMAAVPQHGADVSGS